LPGSASDAPQWQTGTIEIAPGVFAYIQATGGLCVANAGIICASQDITGVDALFTPAMTRALLDESKRVAGREPTQLIDTHHHIDHTLGNALFPERSRIIAHARAKAEMERVGLAPLPVIERLAPHFAGQLDGVRTRLPDVTFDGDALHVDAGGRVMSLLHFGTGHTRGDVLVHLEDERVLFAGDLAFFSVTPLAHEGHIGNWIRIIERVLTDIDADVIVPGHGPVGTKDDLRLMLGYLRLVHDAARRAFDAGSAEEDAVRSIDLGEYAAWTERDRLAPNVARLYRQFRGELDREL
jgi:cyclase